MVNLKRMLRNAGIGLIALGISNGVSYYASKNTVQDAPKRIRQEKAERILKGYENLSFVEKPIFYGSKIAASEYDFQERKYDNFSENSNSKENLSYKTRE